MSDDFVTYLRALAKKHPRTVRSAARMRQPLDGADAQALEGALCSTERERDEARAEIERQARHIEELREKIDAEGSCACSFDAPGDICAAHSPALTRARAEIARLHKAHQAACEGGDLLRAENARLRAQIAEYFTEPATHPVEEP